MRSEKGVGVGDLRVFSGGNDKDSENHTNKSIEFGLGYEHTSPVILGMQGSLSFEAAQAAGRRKTK